MAIQDRLSTIFAPFRLVKVAIWTYYGAFKDAFSKDGFAALTHLKQIQDTAVANLLILASDGFIAYENTTIVPSLVKTARGKILELGPGPGNQIHRFDPTVVEFVYAVDPNPHYGDDIAAKLIKSDLQGKYKLLTCGVEDSDVLRSEGIVECSLDTVLSIQVMCAVDDPKSVMREIWRLLKPGGRFVFWEHGKNRDTFTGITQDCWNPAWSFLVGCNMNRDIKSAILAAGEWENADDINDTEDPYNCLPRISGVLIKKA